MPARRAIDLALDLARTPSLATLMRQQALPPDLLDVIRIAASCPETWRVGEAETVLPLGVIKAAAVLYLQEMLFFPDASSYRNLGVSAGASKPQMRLHMRWLLQWLHPDHNSDETASLLAARVIAAWRELGRNEYHQGVRDNLPDRRSAVRQQRPSSSKRRTPMRVRWIAVPIQAYPPLRRRGRRAVVLVIAAAAALALIFIPDGALLGWLSLSSVTDASTTSAAATSGGNATLVGRVNR